MIGSEKIKNIRLAKDLTQEQVADRLDLSRTSWIAVEKGKRELTLGELRAFSELCNVPMSDLIDLGEEINYGDASEKYKQMLLACLKFGSNDWKLPKTKLAKMLYLVDFAWFHNHKVSMSGFQYKKLQYGPVADEYFRILEEMIESDQLAVVPSGQALLISATHPSDTFPKLSAEEIKLVSRVGNAWRGRSTEEIVSFTHGQAPWKHTKDGYKIPYGLIEQETADTLY